MLKLLFFLCLCLPVCVTAQETQPAEPVNTEIKIPEATSFANSALLYKIISSANNTYGYDIFSDARLLIHQPSIPGFSGNEGFKNKKSSEKVAWLVIQKIKNGEMPPTVTKEKMKKLKAIN